MPLIINEEQVMLKTSAKEFLKEKAPVSALRNLRDTKDSHGYDPELWKEMAEMGWTSLTIPENYGGLDYGYVGLGQILEETGRTLTASPLVSTVLLGATAIQLGGNVIQKEQILPEIVSGKMKLALALGEKGSHNPLQTKMSAKVTAGGFLLSGKKAFVLDGHIADKIIVFARTSGEAGQKTGLSLFLIDSNAEGLKTKRIIMMDSRNAATLEFDNVKVGFGDLLGEEGMAFATLERVLDIACIGLSAEMLGTMLEAFERTIAYLKERKQFGLHIGSFQALQHRAAQMFCEIELCKSVVLKALQAIDNNSNNLSALASMAKAKVGKTLELVTNEAVQMFGGIGMTDDEEIGFFLKRARVAQQTFGDYSYHLDRYAQLRGF